MTIQTSTLRPGLLVALRTSVRGNVTYQRRDLDTQRTEDSEMKRWETERTIADREEFARAHDARGKAVGVIRKVCSRSAFGLLCREDEADKLMAAIAEANRIKEEANATFTLTRLEVNVIAGRIASDDLEAVKAINAEVRELLDDMQRGVEKLDVKMIRDAANRARELGTMLTPDAQARIQLAIDAVRGAAREITKAGEAAAVEVDKRVLRTINESRLAFLDLDGEGKPVEAAPAEARGVDFDSSSSSDDELPYGVIRDSETGELVNTLDPAVTGELTDDTEAIEAPAVEQPKRMIEMD